MKKKSPLLAQSFKEVFTNPPRATRGKSPDAARKQKIAIAFSKARQAGARV